MLLQKSVLSNHSLKILMCTENDFYKLKNEKKTSWFFTNFKTSGQEFSISNVAVAVVVLLLQKSLSSASIDGDGGHDVIWRPPAARSAAAR